MQGKCWVLFFFLCCFFYELHLEEVLSLWVIEQMGTGCWSWCSVGLSGMGLVKSVLIFPFGAGGRFFFLLNPPSFVCLLHLWPNIRNLHCFVRVEIPL